ncbi:DUF4435 domain-containing protein [Pseudomonas aeruginosa]|uniref:DUF4435 domain-containing protein n=1 Tax=Pseudomonas aeruginosa TaxID=287 RepID=UPI0009F85C14|nr:DUF4435 domain-containing protein [Pseudomonas aeruginosa]MBI7027847.1 DUF4435 domain-containing protein [Pseudomonas aeruginosa]MBI9170380.1 DUF4435 domain-containing protein [Pseudomonas aeruginosa]MCO4018685.1 DUF4435 domain-containing protein [Pseudomonas aeruginosa]MCY0315727.1 DUF4435 domain-containing protein [Pseudomonas aeruginosa]MCY0517633.1 DUF4435 domain-containing protein [Pseudomonas aeruginosa]
MNLNNPMAFSADELLNLAIMTKIPVVIVEGVDDVPVYERISGSSGIMCDIYASENLCRVREGCEGVIKNICDIRAISDDIVVENHIIGILDRDARFYRNEMPADPAIFTLNYYSIESHYVNECSIRYLVSQFTKATSRLVTDSLVKEIYDSIVTRLEFLHYVSLEALLNACDRDYKAAFGYSDTIKSIVGRGLVPALEEKRVELDEFANRLGLTKSMETLLKICKGKWIVEIFSDHLLELIKELPDHCAASKIPQCQSCATGNSESKKCMYKHTSFFSADILKMQSFTNTNVVSLNYIKERLLILQKTAA